MAIHFWSKCLGNAAVHKWLLSGIICSFAIILSLITITRKSQTYYDHHRRRRIVLLFLRIQL